MERSEVQDGDGPAEPRPMPAFEAPVFEALVFDFDGLILDTEVPEFQAWQEIFAAHDAVLEIEIWAQCIGSSDHGWDPYAHLADLSGRSVDRTAIRTAKRARVHELIAANPILPGVEAYLRDAREHGLKIGLASSSPLSWVDGHLRRLGLTEHFDTVKTSEDVRRTKPDPALYQVAVEALGVAPERAIALEDSPNGLAAARAAGLSCVVVPNAMTRQLPLHDADMVLTSMADMPLVELLRGVDSSSRRGF
ncbi:HAD family hydrolase [Actinopolymorpha sp. B17G11]|uniref:HAD family hydrolase n=1 Tax=unclassified Actinopolymorpha TaxID=2627063 RepID=UPI0032D8EA8C